MNELPELFHDVMRRIGTTKCENVICGKDMTITQADEVIHRVKAYEELVKENDLMKKAIVIWDEKLGGIIKRVDLIKQALEESTDG